MQRNNRSVSFSSISKFVIVGLLVLMLAAFGCSSSSSSSSSDDDDDNNTNGGTSNSQFLGTFNTSMTLGDCGTQTIPLTVGTDKEKLKTEEFYIYIPSTGSSAAFSYDDDDGESVSLSVSVSGNTISFSQTGSNWKVDVRMAYSSDYKSATITGTLISTDEEECPGTISGTATKSGSSTTTGADEEMEKALSYALDAIAKDAVDADNADEIDNVLKYITPQAAANGAAALATRNADVMITQGCYSVSGGPSGATITYNCEGISGSVSYSGNADQVTVTFNNLTVEGECSVSGTMTVNYTGGSTGQYSVSYDNLTICGESYSGSMTITANASSGEVTVDIDGETYSYGNGSASTDINYSSTNGITGTASATVDGEDYSVSASNVKIDYTCACPSPTSGTLTVMGPDGESITADFSSTTCDNQTITYTYKGMSFSYDLSEYCAY